MKNNILEYKGYHSQVEFCTETCTLRGKIDGIIDLVTFESTDAGKIEEEFHAAVDDYLEFCREVGKEPDKEYKGTFNVRIAPGLHKKIAVLAYRNGESLNSAVEKAIEAYTNEEYKTNVQLQQTVRILSKALETQTFYNGQQPQFGMESKIIPFNYEKINMKYEM